MSRRRLAEQGTQQNMTEVPIWINPVVIIGHILFPKSPIESQCAMDASPAARTSNDSDILCSWKMTLRFFSTTSRRRSIEYTKTNVPMLVTHKIQQMHSIITGYKNYLLAFWCVTIVLYLDLFMIEWQWILIDFFVIAWRFFAIITSYIAAIIIILFILITLKNCFGIFCLGMFRKFIHLLGILNGWSV